MKISFKNIFSLKAKKSFLEAIIFFIILALLTYPIVRIEILIYLGGKTYVAAEYAKEGLSKFKFANLILITGFTYILAKKRNFSRPILYVALPTALLTGLLYGIFVFLPLLIPTYVSYTNVSKYNVQVDKSVNTNSKKR